MPKLKFAVPVYSLHKSSGQAVVKFAGVPFYLGKHNSDASRREYDRLIAEFLAVGRNPHLMVQPSNDSEATVRLLVDAFRIYATDYYVKNGKQTSEVSSFRVVCATTMRLYRDLPVDEFGPRSLKAVREVWLKNGLARSTINRHQRRLVKIFKWGVSEEIVQSQT